MDAVLAGVPEEWLKIIEDPALVGIIEEVSKARTSPPLDKIFEWARLTPFDKVRIVIIAQDPYPDDKAHGLAFSCAKAASLKNIFRALQKSGLMRDLPRDGHLHDWAAQGILLLNRSLTTAYGKIGAHRNLWAAYTQGLITRLEAALERELLFMLWGNDARVIQCKGRRLEYRHPSSMVRFGDFADCPHFKIASELYPDIAWETTPKPEPEPKDAVELMYTDGSCFPNNKAPNAEGGFAIVLVNARKVIIGKLAKDAGAPTNIRAEGMAILTALRYYHKTLREGHVRLYTDSQFWIDMILEYMPNWSDEKLAKKANPDIAGPIKKGWGMVDANFHLVHVYSHGKRGACPYNDMADRAANYARENLANGETRMVDMEKFAN